MLIRDIEQVTGLDLVHSFRTQSGICSLIAQAKKKVYDP